MLVESWIDKGGAFEDQSLREMTKAPSKTLSYIHCGNGGRYKEVHCINLLPRLAENHVKKHFSSQTTIAVGMNLSVCAYTLHIMIVTVSNPSMSSIITPLFIK